MKDRTIEYIEGLLYNYKSNIAIIQTINIQIEELKLDYKGCRAIGYDEKTGSTNKFNSDVENEVLTRDKNIEFLKKRKRYKEIQVEKVEALLSSLDSTEKSIIEMRYFEKIRFKRIAEILSYTEPYIIKKRKVILDRLKKIVKC